MGVLKQTPWRQRVEGKHLNFGLTFPLFLVRIQAMFGNSCQNNIKLWKNISPCIDNKQLCHGRPLIFWTVIQKNSFPSEDTDTYDSIDFLKKYLLKVLKGNILCHCPPSHS